ncbi:IclR family transcriptional regulator C-terminal domain-containing protein [Mycolicibacterium bacteremicum]|uniref:IclR family transcriptional regulator domain-containing protein n=1 Tax=Mycolicibacterium bacteremicum TaxID=564198 RepID=UPI0026EAE9CB|nr:IclR family transcriptional regulator C-terminal domain-containing protein [Mycolicibacterium bacteremicum]
MTWPCFPSVSRMGPAMVLFAVGRIEAAENPEVAADVLRGGWGPFTRHSVTDRGRLRSLLDEARDTGFAHEAEQTVLGVSCMAATLRDDQGRLIGVLGVGGQRNAVESRGVRGALMQSAASLSREIVDLEPTSAEVWNTPIFNRRSEIGYTWPTSGGSAPA